MNKGINTYETILDKAIFIASKTGMEALTIGKLSNSVGMSKGGLFSHFNSKEQLQLDLLKAVTKKFIAKVINPSKKAATGEPQLRVLATKLINWANAEFMPGGCLLHSASIEYDDRPGAVRDFLVENQKIWIDVIGKTAIDAIAEGQFRSDLNTVQFAFEFQSIFPSYQYASRLLNDSEAESRALKILDKLLDDARN